MRIAVDRLTHQCSQWSGFMAIRTAKTGKNAGKQF